MGEVLKNVRIVNPSVSGTITIDGVDVTQKLKQLLLSSDGSAADVKKMPVAVDDNKVRLLTAELEGVKALCKQLSTKVDSLSKPPKEPDPPKEPPKAAEPREKRSKTEK